MRVSACACLGSPQQSAPKGPKERVTKTDFTAVRRAKHGGWWPPSPFFIAGSVSPWVFTHQIPSRLCYRQGFIVNGCRFTCQTRPPFTICNLSAATLPTWLPRFRSMSRTKQKGLDRMFALHFNAFHFTTLLIYGDKYCLFVRHWDICGQANH